MRFLRAILMLFLVSALCTPATATNAADGHLYVFLVRHGQSTDNAYGLQSGWSPASLTPLGIRQAKLMAANLQSQSFSAAYSSGLARADQTLERLLAGRTVSTFTDPNFREWGVGSFEQKPVYVIETAEARRLKTKASQLWKYSDASKFNALASSDPAKKAETWSTFRNRIMRGINTLKSKHQSGSVLVVTHGYVIKHLIRQLSGRYTTLPISNTSVTVLDYSNGKWKVLQGPTLKPVLVD
jgi:probable phosphoglycerate mutase